MAVSSTISFPSNVIRAPMARPGLYESLIFTGGTERLESAQNGVTVMIILDSFETGKKKLRIA